MQQITDQDEQQQASERRTNYLILRTLEQKLNPNLFNTFLKQVQAELELPSHTSWTGQTLPMTYQELKESQSSADTRLLSALVKNQDQKNFSTEDTNLNNSLCQALKNIATCRLNVTSNLYSQLSNRFCQHKSYNNKNSGDKAWTNFERVKTVFGHTDFSTDEVSAIYNVYFDQKGDFIISAGDEGTIKIWDRHTLTLQASLHGHDDFITEIDISKCNRFIASAGKDAQIIIWELATGKILYRLLNHTKLINCVKFFTPKLNDANKPHEQQQYLFSCSDDGTVRLYDVTCISAWRVNYLRQQQLQQEVPRKNSEDDFKIRRSNRQKPSQTQTSQDPFSQPTELHSIELTPDDFRPGTRNKKLDTLVMNQSGLVVAGSSSGELLVWRLNYDLIAKRVPKSDSYMFLGQFKMSKQSCVKFCEFSPNKGVQNMGDYLLTGSVDGQVIIWDLSVKSWKNFKRQTFTLEDGSRQKVTFDEQGCREIKEITTVGPDGIEEKDYIPHDVVGTSKFKELSATTKSVCDAVKWSCNGRFAIASIQCRLESEGIDICKVKIWDTVEENYIEDLARLSSIRLPQNTFVLAPHPHKEEILVTGSDNGVVVLWNIHTKQLIKQFKQHGVYSVDANIMDNPLHGSWSPDGTAFAAGNGLGTITFYTNKDIAHQYEATRIQQFFMYDLERQSDNPFERITERPMVCSYNMIPYEIQPDRLLIRFTQPRTKPCPISFKRQMLVANELGQIEERYYQDKLQNSMIEGNNVDQLLQPMESIQYSMIQPPAQGDDEVDLTGFQIVNQLQQRGGNNEDEPRRIRVGRPRLQRNNDRQSSSLDVPDSSSSQSQQDQSDQMSDSSEEMDSEDESIHPGGGRSGGRLRRNAGARTNQTGGRNPARPVRAARPANLRDIETYPDNSHSDIIPHLQQQRNTRNRRQIDSSDTSSVENINPRHTQQNGRGEQGYSQRYQRNQNRIQRNRNIEESSEEVVRPGRAFARKNQVESDDEYSLSVQGKQKRQFSSYMSDNPLDDENEDKIDFTSHMLLAAQKCQNNPKETHYELIRDGEIPKDQPCYLCNRCDGEIVGPFKKDDHKAYFHKDCVEVNTYSFFSLQLKKWVNIDSMLKGLKGEKSYKCYRCDLDGASVSCQICGKNFHGYLCAGLYLLKQALDPSSKFEGTNPQYWQCFFCQNQHNFNQYAEMSHKDEKVYLNQLRKIDKSYLLGDIPLHKREQQSPKALTYIPQVDDVVVYFFQGHEDFIYQYNCHFYAGQNLTFPKKQMIPWLNSKGLKNVVKTQPFMLCKVNKVETFFPSQRSLKLISQYGQEASDCPQTPQLIQRMEMQFIGTSQDKFVVDIFPNELPDFLVPYQTFLAQWNKYKTQQNLKDKIFQVKLKSRTQKMKIIGESPFESLFCPDSQWLNILAQPVVQQDSSSRRQITTTTSDEVQRINFWQILFDGEICEEIHGFQDHEHIKMRQFLQQYMQKNRDYLVYFKERVEEKIAPDYRQIIAQEMWFDLIQARLINKYYRTINHFYADLDQIVTNAQVYNGPNHDVAIDASEIVKKFKSESLKHLDSYGDRQVKERGNQALVKLQEVKDSLLKRETKQCDVLMIEETKDEVEQHPAIVQTASLGYQQRNGGGGKRLRSTRRIDEHSPETETINLLNQGEGVLATRTTRKRQRQI